MIEVLSRLEVQQFIRDHEHHDPFQLVLQASKYPDMPIKAIAEQIRARQKAKNKLPEWYQQEGIIFPALLSVEQCSSETTARYKSTLISGESLVDLTGGAGVDTYYMSQPFAHTDYVEQHKELAAVTKHNFGVLQAGKDVRQNIISDGFNRVGDRPIAVTPDDVGNISIHNMQAEQFLQGMDKPVDCIFIDPARRDEHASKVFKLEDCTPDVVALKDTLLAKAQNVLIKTSPMLDIDAAVGDLQKVHQIHVIAVNNECKEVIYWLKNITEEPEVITINFQGNQQQFFQLSKSHEATAEVSFSAPLEYLYEPNVAVLKAGAFKSVAQAYGLFKLHPHTHLYTSSQLVSDFPGRIFRCEAVSAYNRKEVQKALPVKKANLTVRNFPASVQQARKKLSLSDGGAYYLFLCTFDDKPQVIITQKILKRK